MKVGNLVPIKEVRTAGNNRAAEAERPASVSGKTDFVPGQLLKGRVVGVAAEGKVTLQINGQTMEARTEVPLKAGMELWLEAGRTRDSLWFTVAEKKGAAQEFIRQMLIDMPSFGRAVELLASFSQSHGSQLPPEVLAGLEELFQQLAENAVGKEAGAEKIVRLLSWLNGGQAGSDSSRAFFSTRLSEQLVQLSHLLVKTSDPRFLHKTGALDIQKYAGMLETIQHMNTQAPSLNQQLFLLFPCFFAGGEGWGEWMFSLEDEGGSEKGERDERYALTFFLKMSRIGDLHLQVNIKGNALQGLFSVSSEAGRAHLDTHLPELRAVLQKMDYEPVNLSCCVAKKSLIQELKEELEEKAQITSANILDIRA